MATETTTPSESTMNEVFQSIDEKMEELRIEKIDDAPKAVDTSIPEAEEKEILKEEETREVSKSEIPEDQLTREVALAETETQEDQDSLKVTETEIPKDQDSHEITDSSPRETSNVEEIPKAKEKDTFEADTEKEVNAAEVREVSVPTVDHRSGAGDERKTEDVPTTVVHETTDGGKPSPGLSGDIFQNVGSKMMQSVQKLKNVISGKSSSDNSSKSTD